MQTLLKLGIAGIATWFSGCSGIVKEEIVRDDAVSVDEAIVHGALDRGRHPGVVALFADEGTAQQMCTAFVIAPDVLVTARHCVAELRTSSVECPARVPQVGRPFAAASLSVRLGDDVRAAAPAAFGRSIHTPYTDALCDADIAVVTLDRPLPVRPMVIARKPPPVGPIVAVGYGIIGPSGREGLRRFRQNVPIIAATPTEITVAESTCSGDSGGPAIDEASGEVIGVLSRGNVDCTKPTSRNIYVKTLPFLDLIDRILGYSGGAPAVEPTPSAPTDIGDECRSGAACATGLCVEPGPSGYCSRACGPASGKCPTGYRCARSASQPNGVCARRVP